MTYFTRNPLERLMMKPPIPQKDKPKSEPAPKGHFCFGCKRYGMACVRPCYRDRKIKSHSEIEK